MSQLDLGVFLMLSFIEKKQYIVLQLLEKVFLFQKDAFYDIVHAYGI